MDDKQSVGFRYFLGQVGSQTAKDFVATLRHWSDLWKLVATLLVGLGGTISLSWRKNLPSWTPFAVGTFILVWALMRAAHKVCSNEVGARIEAERVANASKGVRSRLVRTTPEKSVSSLSVLCLNEGPDYLDQLTCKIRQIHKWDPTSSKWTLYSDRPDDYLLWDDPDNTSVIWDGRGVRMSIASGSEGRLRVVSMFLGDAHGCLYRGRRNNPNYVTDLEWPLGTWWLRVALEAPGQRTQREEFGFRLEQKKENRLEWILPTDGPAAEKE